MGYPAESAPQCHSRESGNPGLLTVAGVRPRAPAGKLLRSYAVGLIPQHPLCGASYGPPVLPKSDLTSAARLSVDQLD
jgi:hypothetical protein